MPRRLAPAAGEDEPRRPRILEFVLLCLGWVFVTFLSVPVVLAWMLGAGLRDLVYPLVRGVVPAALVVLAAALLPWWPLQALAVVVAVSMLTFLTFTLLIAPDVSEQQEHDAFNSLLTVLIVATGAFAAATFALAEHGRITVENWASLDNRMGATVGFYAWQFLNAIPLLNAPDTLRWAEPLEYRDRWVGALVLLFKVAIIIPIVGAIRALLRDDAEAARPADEPATGTPARS